MEINKKKIRPYLLSIAENGLAYPANLQALFFLNELIEIRDACNLSIEAYEFYNFTDEHISKENKKYLDNEYERFKSTNKIQEKDTDTNIYVMIDHNTGYYKIGRSKNPTRRESTLQSEKPTIELLCSYPATNKEESEIHYNYREFRIRGEWFNLEKWQVDDITKQLRIKAEMKRRGII
jgi:hypothetical protein